MKNTVHLLLFFVLGVHIADAQNVSVLDHDEKVRIVKLNELNTSQRECNLSLMPSAEVMYFMSTRASDRGLGDGDIYRTRGAGAEWSAPEYVQEVNTNRGEDEPSISADGEKIYFQSWKGNWQSTGGPYYEAYIKDGKLKSVRGLGDGINQFFRRQFNANMGYATDGMAVSPDGNLFIVACGPRYDGNMDLYYSTKRMGVWTFPELLGVSSLGDERSVFISSDGKTIYFSSDGHGGYGGLDILKTSWDGTRTGEIVNVGKPFNTSKDDMGFVVSGKGESAYFVRDLDIYYADLSKLEESIKPAASCLIFGTVTLNTAPMEATVVVKSKGKILGKASTDEFGKYVLSLPPLSDAVEVSVEDGSGLFELQKVVPDNNSRYVEYEINFDAEREEETRREEVTRRVEIEINEEPAAEEPRPEALIYFDFDEFTLTTKETAKLKKLLKSINQSSLIFIIGHTDHVGSNQYNMDLSRKRAETVQNWIIKFAGLKKGQIDLRFKGETTTLNSGATPEDRAKNRRVSVRVLNH